MQGMCMGWVCYHISFHSIDYGMHNGVNITMWPMTAYGRVSAADGNSPHNNMYIK